MSQSSLNSTAATTANGGGTVDDQQKALDEAMHAVKVHSFHMNKCLNDDRMMETIKHASSMLAELKSSSLTPKNFYELYMAIFDQLRRVSSHLQDRYSEPASVLATDSLKVDAAASDAPAARTIALSSALNQPTSAAGPGRHKLAELYEMVQYASSIVPRLFLMITVGTVYMSVANSPKRDLMMDMLDMCKGVQHPTRGLFLRYYLQQLTRDLLPQTTAEDGSIDGNLDDTIYFVLSNFTEMNKLWVRLQHQGHSRDRLRREQERRDLRILVGTNLVRLSQLDGLTLDIYKTTVLPKILEQVVSCKDVIAQDYLLEAIIQVFQDDFHLWTLGQLLEATGKLQQQVNIKNIIISFIDRFTAYAKRERENATDDQPAKKSEETGDETAESVEPKAKTATELYRPGIPDEIQLFDVFWKEITGIITARENLTIADATALLVSLMNLGLSCYPERLDYIEKVYMFAADRFKLADAESLCERPAAKLVLELIAAPLRVHPSILTLLRHKGSSDALCKMVKVLPYPLRRSTALAICRDIVQKRTVVQQAEFVSRLLSELMGPLVRDHADGGAITESTSRRPGEIDLEEVKEAQSLVARLVHLFRAPPGDTDGQFAILTAERAVFAEGGAHRIVHTLPALMTQCLQLAINYRAQQLDSSQEVDREALEAKLQQLFKFMHQTVSLLQRADQHDLALRLFLMPLQDPVILIGFEMVAYEFVVQAFTIYEDSISQSKSQIAILHLMMGTLYAASNRGIFGRENYDTLATKCALYASKMLRKDDQCRLVLLCSHLFWGRDVVDGSEEVLRMNQLLLPADAVDSEPAQPAVDTQRTPFNAASAMEEQLRQITPAAVPQFGMDEMADGMYEGFGTPPSKAASPTVADTKPMPNSNSKTKSTRSTSTQLSEAMRNEYVYRDGKRVLECLQKSLKIADSCMDALVNVQLFTDILNLYICFYDKGNASISSKFVNGLVDLVFSHCQTLHSDPAAIQSNSAVSASTDDIAADMTLASTGAVRPVQTPLQQTERHFRDTLRHARAQKEKYAAGPVEQLARWNEVSVVDDVLATVESWVK